MAVSLQPFLLIVYDSLRQNETSGKLTHPQVFGTGNSVSPKYGPGAPDIGMPGAPY